MAASNSPSPTIRLACQDDLPALFALNKVSVGDGRINQADIRRCLKEQADTQWVLVLESRIVGALYTRPLPSLDALAASGASDAAAQARDAAAFVQILAWGVEPDAALALGEALLKHAVDALHAAAQPARVVLLTSWDGPMPADGETLEDRDGLAHGGDALALHRTLGARLLRVLPAERGNFGRPAAPRAVLEFVQPPSSAAFPPLLFVLSAANAERLRAYVEKVLAWLERAPTPAEFRNAIYTWQIGRTAMRHRLAMRVEDADALRARLRAWLDGAESLSDTWSSLSAATTEGTQDDRSEIETLARTWVGGETVDWQRLYADVVPPPQRIALPTYPFAGVRHWYAAPTVAPASQAASAIVEVAAEHAPVEVQTAVAGKDAASPAGGAAEQRTALLQLAPSWDTHPLTVAAQADGPGAPARHIVLVCGFADMALESSASALASVQWRRLRAPAADDGHAYMDMVCTALECAKQAHADRDGGWALVQVLIEDRADAHIAGGLWGLLRTAAQEYPDFVAQTILSDGTSVSELARQLHDEAREARTEQVRYRQGVRYRHGWHALQSHPAAYRGLREGGVYCVTGGLGGLGAMIAAELLRRGKGVKVVLIGRRPLGGALQAQFDALRALADTRAGAEVAYRAVDIAAPAAVTALVEDTVSRYGHLHGIVHAAGVLEDGRIAGKTADAVRRVLAPKVLGAIHLDIATRGLGLDFFALFASITGVVGNDGQADYASANAFQDAFAHARNARVAAGHGQGRTVAIDWPLWQDGGMQFTAERLELIRRETGMVPLRTDSGLDVFFASLQGGPEQRLVLEGDVKRMQGWLERMLHPPRVRVAMSAQPADDLGADALRDAVLRQLVRVFAEATEREPGQIDADDPMENYGLDSIIINRLNLVLGDVLPGLSRTVFFEFRTLAALSDELVARHAPACRAWVSPAQSASFAEDARVEPAPEAEKPVRSVASHASSAHVALPVGNAGAGRGVPAGREPIAIVGISGVYPKAPDLQSFWRNIRDGRDCIEEIPAERWSLEGFFEADETRAIEQGKSYGKWGGFVDGFADFDPQFFNISPREALNIDPQERMFLQECWRAMESAGYTRQDLKARFGGRVGVFAGITKTGYQLYAMHRTLDGEPFLPYTSFSSTANRVSYLLDIHGPSMPVDTMCASSLTAIHEACEHILRGECDVAFAGGVNLYLHPNSYLWLSSQHMLSTDGRCRSFGAGGHGFVPGEGVGVVLLKRLSEAERDGDPIHGVILATHVNHGGRTHGYTVPNPNAQAALIRAAIDAAGIDARAISYIETHGTGTELGDPIEITGLERAFAIAPGSDYRCRIGSVKSNIGHLEAAAGIASLTKVLLQMRHGELVPSLHSTTLNPNIDWQRSPFEVNTRLQPWATPRPGAPRIAGISSFGASGTNVHVIVQEYRAPAIPPVEAGEPVLLPLSARSEHALLERARGLLAHLEANAGRVDLLALAYTLQVGREAMEYRLCCVVRSVEELKRALRAHLERGTGPVQWHAAHVAEHREALRIFTRDEDFRLTVQRWVERRKLDLLAEFWVRGLEVDWHELYGEHPPARIPLPSYPFAQERLWVDTRVAPRSLTTPPNAALHPLVHVNISDLYRQAYAGVLSGNESCLRDHVVGGDKVLPGVAYLEMVRVAMDRALPDADAERVLELHNTVWVQPLVVNTPRPVEIVLRPEGDSGRIAFEVASSPMPPAGHAVAGDATRRVHCQGEAVFVAEASPAAIDLRRLQARMARGRQDADAIYRRFDDAGVAFGPAHRGVREVALGEGEAFAWLTLPDAVSPADPAYVLHPSLMDSALQACSVLGASAQDNAGGPLLPFALDRLRVFAPCRGDVVAWVRLADKVRERADAPMLFDVDIIGGDGRVCVQIRGFSTRPRVDASSRTEFRRCVPVWERIDPVRVDTVRIDPARIAPAATKPLVVVGGGDAGLQWVRRSVPDAVALPAALLAGEGDLTEYLREHVDDVLWLAPDIAHAEIAAEVDTAAAQTALHEVFRLVKAALDLAAPPRWTFLTRRIHAVGARDAVSPAHAGIAGFVGSLSREYPHWDIRLIDVDGIAGHGRGHPALAAADCVRIEGERFLQCVAWRDGEWFRRGLATLDAASAPNDGYRQGGTYIVVGGAGGIGEAWSREMIERYDARLIWIGRRPLDAGIAAKIEALGRIGRAPEYLSTDASDLKALQRTAERIRAAHPAIHGVVHSAIDLRDQSLAQMDAEELERAVAAKMAVAVNLDRVFGDLDLDFVLFFSSMISFMTSAGQANYSAGSTFVDSFALALGQRRPYAVKIMNWGYWGGVGVVADAFHQEQMRQRGVGSIEVPEAMAALRTLVSHPTLTQIGAVALLDQRALGPLEVSERVGVRRPVASSGLPESVDDARRQLVVPSADVLRSDQPGEDMDALAAELTVAALAKLGIDAADPLERALARVQPTHARWLATSLQIARDFGRAPRAWDAIWRDWDACRPTWLQNPRLGAQTALLEACLRELPEILGGARAATDVIFPNASMDLVQGVYQGHALADCCNAALGEVLTAWLRRQPSSAPIRMLEIGAGTGGTTTGLLPRLAQFGARLEEYCYTDLSKAFLIHAETRFRAQCPALRTAIFDVSRAPVEQGIDIGRYDAVIATNVLHATPDMRRTLRHAKALLRPGGVVLINEMTGWSITRHLTFGLLEGWWLYEDAALREAGSPGLSTERWRQLLQDEGFQDIAMVVPQTHAFGQFVIAGASDGRWRQRVVASTPVSRPALPLAQPAPVAQVEASPADASASSAQRASLAATAAATADNGLHARCTAYLRRAVAETLRLDESRVGLNRPLADYGLDSILVIGLTSQLRKAFPDIASTLFFEARDLSDLAQMLLKAYPAQAEALFGGAGNTASVSGATTAAAPAARTMVAPLAPAHTADAASALSPHARCAAYLRSAVAETLRLDESRVGLNRPLADYGLDSILVIGLTSRLRKAFPDIPSTVFFEAQHLSDLADMLLRNYPAQVEALFGAQPSAQPDQPTAAQGDTSSALPLRGLRLSLPQSASQLPVPTGASAPVVETLPRDVAAFDVAIIGMSGRYPMANDLDTFWNNLAQGRNCIAEVPAERWNWRDVQGEPGDGSEGIYTRWGGFLDRIDQFDPLYFRISPKDAKAMDPQERQFLHACYHAIEDAGYRPDGLAPADKVGVFVGAMNARYTEQPLHYSIANRVSFALDFQGPSVAVDTACSASLTAIHMALESLYNGSSACAIAGGVNLIIDAGHFRELTAVGMLSHGDSCRAFGAGADGFVDAEGVGAVVLKPLAQAERDGDPIYAVIKGSAINAGGRTHGYTVPNPTAQAAVVAEALRRARVNARDVSCIEAHGTGTALGDPIEVAGLRRAFERDTQDRGFCALSSLKSNIGHCESAAGIAALAKVVLQLRHGQLAPTLHVDQVNPEIDFAKTPFRLQRTLGPWERPRRVVDGETREVPRIAGISSFGAGGANAHLIVQEYIPTAVRAQPAQDARRHLVPLSARTAEQLAQKGADLLAYLERAIQRGEQVSLPALAYTLQVGREQREERLALLVDSPEALIAALRSGVDAATGPLRFRGRLRRDGGGPVDSALDPLTAAPDALARDWVDGAAIDWARAWPEASRPQRLRLPLYPFAKDTYWQPARRPLLGAQQAVQTAQAVAAPAPVVQQPAQLHPLLHRNVSTLTATRYDTVFARADALASDHRLDAGAFRGRVLPAAVYLEMAHAAALHAMEGVSEAAAVELAQTTWAAPAVFEDALRLRVALLPRAGGAAGYEIVGPASQHPESVLCQGLVRPLVSAPPAPLDLAALRARTDLGAWTAERFYRERAEAGQQYGHAYRSVSQLRSGNGEALAELCLPAATPAAHATLRLAPVLLDGAMQAAATLLPVAMPASLPWRLMSLKVFRACPAQVWAWVRRSSQGGMPGLDIDLCDADGRICLQLRGLHHGAVDAEEQPQPAAAARVAEQPVAPAKPAPAMPAPDIQQRKTKAAAAKPTVALSAPSATVAAPVDAGAVQATGLVVLSTPATRAAGGASAMKREDESALAAGLAPLITPATAHEGGQTQGGVRADKDGKVVLTMAEDVVGAAKTPAKPTGIQLTLGE